MSTQISFIDDKKTTLLTGYSFIDEMNKCIIIVYGERKRDLLQEYLLEKDGK